MAMMRASALAALLQLSSSSSISTIIIIFLVNECLAQLFIRFSLMPSYPSHSEIRLDFRRLSLLPPSSSKVVAEMQDIITIGGAEEYTVEFNR